jgi:hypothetical protein
MAHAIFEGSAILATNVDARVRSAKATVDIDNGNVFALNSLSNVSGEGEVFIASTPGATPTGLWMAVDPEVVTTASKYKGIDPDPRNFVNEAGKVFAAIKPMKYDIVTLTGDAFTAARTNEGYAIAQEGSYELVWSATAGSGFALKLLKTKNIPVGSERVTGYMFEVVTE